MTYGQKFILYLKSRKNFKQDCDFLIKSWNVRKDKDFYNCEIIDLPNDYKKDLRFVLKQHKLPERFLKPLHEYLLNGNIPELDALPKPVDVFLRYGDGLGKIIIEADIDITQKELNQVLSDINSFSDMQKMVYELDKKSQPIRDFDTVLKIIEDKENIHIISEDMADWKSGHQNIKKKIKKTKNRLYKQKSEYLKEIDSKIIPVEKREEYEEYINNIEPPF
jgi:hypothetical protein